MRQNLTFAGLAGFQGGINEYSEDAGPNQLLDARNVWCPKSTLQTRPGYRGVSCVPLVTTASITSGGLIKETPLGTFTAVAASVTLNSLPVGSRWYFGATAIPTGVVGLTIGLSADNSAATSARMEYWNGTRWALVDHVQHLYGLNTGAHLQDDQAGRYSVLFTPPLDWTQVAVNTSTKYWLRFTIQTTALDASVTATIGGIPGSSWLVAKTDSTLVGMYLAQFTQGSLFAQVEWNKDGGTGALEGTVSTGITQGGVTAPTATVRTAPFSFADSPFEAPPEPVTFAALPEFGVVYAAATHGVYELSAVTTQDISGPLPLAQVNADPVIVGAGADYDPAVIAQLEYFPKAKYVRYFKNLLWLAGIPGRKHDVVWGAAGLDGAYNVFPVESFEPIVDTDADGITALAPFIEHMIVFKRDSMYAMVFAGFDDNGLAMFDPKPVKVGVGCVSQASVVEINGRLIWLAEDGFYSYDGRQVRKLSNAISETVLDISPARRTFTSGVHWRTQNAYMCSASMNGSAVNDLVFVYDYSKESTDANGAFTPGSWWLWDNIEAQTWLKAESPSDAETVYFADRYGHIFEMVGATDHGVQIESYILTHRLSAFGYVTSTLGELRVKAYQAVNTLTADVLVDDREVLSDLFLDFTDDVEGKWGSAPWGSEWVPRSRRERRLELRESCEDAQVRLSATGPVEYLAVRLGFTPLGRR